MVRKAFMSRAFFPATPSVWDPLSCVGVEPKKLFTDWALMVFTPVMDHPPLRSCAVLSILHGIAPHPLLSNKDTNAYIPKKIV
jgi:hypothetical protein